MPEGETRSAPGTWPVEDSNLVHLVVGYCRRHQSSTLQAPCGILQILSSY